MNSSTQRYHIGAWIKIGVGVLIAVLLWTLINPREDPAVAMGLLLVALFLVGRGVSFYFFWGVNALVHRMDQQILSDSYKMSLLFGFFVIINATLIFLEARSKVLGMMILVVFMGLFVVLFRQTKQRKNDR